MSVSGPPGVYQNNLEKNKPTPTGIENLAGNAMTIGNLAVNAMAKGNLADNAMWKAWRE